MSRQHATNDMCTYLFHSIKSAVIRDLRVSTLDFLGPLCDKENKKEEKGV